MRIFLLFALTFFLLSSNQKPSYAQQPSVLLEGAQGEYKNLDEIKPMLVNDSDISIFLLPEDCGEAGLWLHYMNKNWMQGISKDCDGRDTAIEIKPGESYQIPVLVWRPLTTREGKLIERKNFPGRYRIVMRYSLKPFSNRWGKPRLKFKKDIMEVSEEFIIVQ